MLKNKLFLFSLCAVALNCSYAQIKPIVGFSVGLKQKSPAQNQVVNFTIDEFGDYEHNAYIQNKQTVNKFSGNIHGGILFEIPKRKLKLTAELAWDFKESRRLNGQVWEAALPDFNNFTYYYNVSSKGFMFESRLMYLNAKWFPYVLVGAGPAWNQAYAYREYPNNETAISLKGNFPSHTKTSFAYEGGFGMGITLNKLLLSVEYKHQELGKAQFALYPFQTINDQLTTSLKSNQFLINLNYLI